MPENLDSCPICGGKTLLKKFSCTDYTVSGEEFTIVECAECSFTFTNPRPDENEIVRYYKSENYISHSDTKKGVINRLYHTVRSINLKRKLRVVERLTMGKGTLLDYGCGTGYFLAYAKKAHWQVTGVEVDTDSAKMAKDLSGAEVYTNIFDANLPEQSFDAITLWHVLEHVHKLHETVAKLKSLLKSNGHLIIAVPNRASYDGQIYGRFWAAYDVPRHLYHFEPGTMKLLAEKHNMEVIKSAGMQFDSYYISMLSEKYRYGKNRMLAAFFNGLKSNKLGKARGHYSSMIYVLKANNY